MLLPIIKLLVDDTFEIDCAIYSGTEKVVKARYAYFHFGITIATQKLVSKHIGISRNTVPYGLDTFYVFMQNKDYRLKIDKLEQQIDFIKKNEEIMLKSKRYDCLCRDIPEGSEFKDLEINRDYKFIIIDDERINWRPFVVVFMYDGSYMSFSAIKFKQCFEVFTINNK